MRAAMDQNLRGTAATFGAAPEAPAGNGAAEPGPAPDRYLIKNARLRLEVDDARAAADALTGAAANLGGYVSSLDEYTTPTGGSRVELTLRLPAARFEQSMERFAQHGKVLEKQVDTQDVTEEFLDVEARLRNLERTEERLLDHLSRTGDLEDIVRVEQEISKYREQIERLEGRLRYLENRVSFSTFRVTLQEEAQPRPAAAETYSTKAVVSKAAGALARFARALWTFVIWAAIWSPVWLVLAAIAWWGVRLAARRPRPRTPQPPQAQRDAPQPPPKE
jgi:hypothetical protein